MSVGLFGPLPGSMFGALFGSSGGGSSSTTFAPGSHSFVFETVTAALFADGDEPYQVTVAATSNADGSSIATADLIDATSGIKVYLSFALDSTSTAHLFRRTAWLYGATAGVEIVGPDGAVAAAVDSLTALSRGVYFAHIRIATVGGEILKEASLGVLTVR